MEKSATLNLRVNPNVKERAEAVLSQLGIPMSTAIDMYLNQISLIGGIPFKIELPQTSRSVNIDLMTDEELYEKLKKGYAAMEAGRVQDAKAAFEKFLEDHAV